MIMARRRGAAVRAKRRMFRRSAAQPAYGGRAAMSSTPAVDQGAQRRRRRPRGHAHQGRHHRRQAGVQVASITKRPNGYAFAHVEGSSRPASTACRWSATRSRCATATSSSSPARRCSSSTTEHRAAGPAAAVTGFTAGPGFRRSRFADIHRLARAAGARSALTFRRRAGGVPAFARSFFMQIRVLGCSGIRLPPAAGPLVPARRRRADRRRHRRRRPRARRDGAHRPHPGQPLAPGPRAGDGLLADSVMPPQRRRRPPVQVHALPQTTPCAATCSMASSGPTSRACPRPTCRAGARLLADRGRSGAGTRRPARRGAERRAHRAGGRLRGSVRRRAWATGDTGPNPALWDWLATMKVSPGHRDRFRDDEHELAATVSRHSTVDANDELARLTNRRRTSRTSSRARSRP